MSRQLADIGEFGAIALFQELLASSKASLRPEIGIGDDAAVWAPTPGDLALETTDLLIEEVHFSLRYFSWYDAGWKAMAVNISDIAAMGGRPRAAFVSAGLKPDMLETDARELYRGLAECAAEYDVAILGGDTVASPAAVILNVAIYGESTGPLLRRDAARPGDTVGISGPLGASAAALHLVASAEHLTPTLSRGDRERALKAHVRPRPRVALGQELLAAGVRCAMDVSDGLVADLGKICAASGVGARIELDRVPVADEVRRAFPDLATQLALTGGEDYELLACGTQNALEQHGLIAVGNIVTGAGVIVLSGDGQEFPLERTGYDAFVRHG